MKAIRSVYFPALLSLAIFLSGPFFLSWGQENPGKGTKGGGEQKANVRPGLVKRQVPNPPPVVPGQIYQFPERPTAAGAPVVFEHSQEAGPDQSFLLVGDKLTTELVVWGGSARNEGGQEWKANVHFLAGNVLAATLPGQAPDGPFLVWVKNQVGYSAPVVLNVPQPWWCGPDIVPDMVEAYQEVRLFGRNLSRRPDFGRAFIYLCQPGKVGKWAAPVRTGKYEVTFKVPEGLAPGEYEVWVHAGAGGDWGWGKPVKLRIREAVMPRKDNILTLKSSATGAEIQQAMNTLAEKGGGIVTLPEGVFNYSGTLTIPARVTLRGAEMKTTTLQLVRDRTARFSRLSGSGWFQAPGAIHYVGDTIDYQLAVPSTETWTVWLHYATDMAPWKQPGVSGHHALIVDDGAPVSLENLLNTGGFGKYQWSKTAALPLKAGKHKLTWKNIKGGGISLDAFVFARDPAFTPSSKPFPVNAPGVIVLQGEDCYEFHSRDGDLPAGQRAAIHLAGNGAGIQDLTVLGTPQVNYGIAICSTKSLEWIEGCLVRRVKVADCEGKQAENCGIYVHYADRARILDNELWGRAPLFIHGARRSEFSCNRLVLVTRFGGNAEAAILGRNETIEQCIVEGNVIASPPGAEAGGPTARRLLWFSTGHGSITHNWISGNGVEPPANGAPVGAPQARFGGVAGTDQNVGEMILFEANHRTAYFGSLAAADPQSVTLPTTIPDTPKERLGNVDRKQLAHDAAGKETPFWPPDNDDGTEEPPLGEYYVSIMAGPGQGQTRRILRREGERLFLDQPWTVPPNKNSLVVVGTAFYQNLIVGNHTPDGMTGIQLWISCIENIIAGNTISRQRKPGLFLYANGTTLASSMPRTWNRGLSPLFWNLAEGNRTEECSAGALVTSGDAGNLPVEFPRALGNVLRHNSFLRNRTDGVIITSRKAPSEVKDTSASVVGTICEFNLVRDAGVAYHAAGSSNAIVFRRNHAYFWYPVNNSTQPPTAFQVDDPATVFTVEHNSIEGIHGVHDGRIIDLRIPEGAKRLKE